MAKHIRRRLVCPCLRLSRRRSTPLLYGLLLVIFAGLASIPLSAQEPATGPSAVGWSNLFHPDPATRQQTYDQVVDATEGFAVSPEFLSKLSSSDPAVRSQLGTILKETPTAKDSEFLLELLAAEQVEVRRLGVRAASSQSQPATIEHLKKLVETDPDSVVQAEARLALAEMPVPNKIVAPQQIDWAEIDVKAVSVPTIPKRSVPEAAIQLASATSVVTESPELALPRPFDAAMAGELNGASLAAVAPTPTPENLPGLIRLPEPDFAQEVSPNLEPQVLDRPLVTPEDLFVRDRSDPFEDILLAYPVDAPLGFAGRSGIIPEDYQTDSHFVPMADRWRTGLPAWDRYGKGHPSQDDYPYIEGNWWDPYNQNVAKGDYPLIGQHTFLRFTGQALLLNEYRQLPVATTPFESTNQPHQEEFFGNPNQYFTTNYFKMSFEVFHGSTAFKPFDWSIRLTPIFNINYLNVQELGIVNPNVRNGSTRYDQFMALEEYFLETKLADLSPDYDFVSARVGSQPFTSDFRGFIFSDINRAVRLFGTRLANRDQFNLIFFDQTEKDTNSQLNTFKDRHQNTLIANYYRQDFIFPGYTAQASVHYNRDGPSLKFDSNGFLVRPDPAGVALQHRVDACYLGFAGEGHIGRVNIANAFYWALGRDTMNPIAGQQQDINAQMAAIELSYDRDWIRFRGSFFYASGDNNPFDKHANGFDSVFDNPNFAGGEFSFWQRQQIQLFGVSLVNRFSLVPDLRSSKFQGQTNFVNPGLNLFNLGMDFELTPKLRLITNANYLQFDNTAVLEAFTFQGGIHKEIGVDLSTGLEYRPFLNDNVVVEGGYAALLTGKGFKDLYGKTDPFTTANAANYTASTLHQVFLQMALTF